MEFNRVYRLPRLRSDRAEGPQTLLVQRTSEQHAVVSSVALPNIEPQRRRKELFLYAFLHIKLDDLHGKRVIIGLSSIGDLVQDSHELHIFKSCRWI